MKHDLDDILLEMRITARIVVDPRGGPIRRIINGRHHKPTGRYSSAKARRAMPWEDKRERAFFWHCEADTKVKTYLAQPHRLEINIARPMPLIYFPDTLRNMADGSVEIVEVKREYDPAEDPDYDLKLNLAATIYRKIGWSFRIVEAADIEHLSMLETVWTIQRSRHARVSLRENFSIREALERNGGSAPFAIVAEALGGGPAGEARLCASIVRRIASVDITSRLKPDTEVTAVHATEVATYPSR